MIDTQLVKPWIWNNIFQGGIMEKGMLKGQKERLLNLRSQILNGSILTSCEDLTVSSDDLADETDLASSVINQQVTFNIRQREMMKLRAIEEALAKVEDGTYGLCEECDMPIGRKRLENQPWASLCIEHAEERERENSQYSHAPMSF